MKKNYPMKECPKCGSKAKNILTKKRFLASVVSWLASWPIGAFVGVYAGNEVRENIHKRICKQMKYKCTNPPCRHEWLCDREDE